MHGVPRNSNWTLRWSGVIAGAAVAIAATWTGQLINGLFITFTPEGTSAWSWLGALVGLVAVVAGTWVGGYVAARVAIVETRREAMLHGLIVWGLLGVVSSMLFAILGGNVPLVVGATTGALRLALGVGMVGLVLGLISSLSGGLAAYERTPAGIYRSQGRAAARTRVATPTRGPGIREEEQRPTTTWSVDNPPDERGPPRGGSVH